MALQEITAGKVYYALEADRPITTTGISVGSLVIFTDSGLEESFDGTAWFSREQLLPDPDGKISGRVEANMRTLLSGEDQDNNVLNIEEKYGYEIVTRTITDVIVGTVGGSGDILQKVIVTSSPTVTDLTISDNGNVHLTIPVGVAVGTTYDVGYMCLNAWTVDADAGSPVAGTGTLICVGRFS